MPLSIIIIGAGIAGLTSALALTTSDPTLKCTVYELRDTPSTIGGAVNLTPNALRLMSSFGVLLSGCPVDAIEIFSVHTAAKLGELPFQKQGGALRVMREELQRALLDAVAERGVEVVFGRRFAGVEHEGEKVVVFFANGDKVTGDLVLGCDGMHSAVRTAFVEPSRKAIYTGVAAAYSVFSTEGMASAHFKSTALNSGRYGSLMTTFVDEERKVMFASAVMEIPAKSDDNGEGGEIASGFDREGWRVRAADHDGTMKEIRRRFEGSAITGLMGIVERMREPIFYPVFKLGPKGSWSKGRVILLGDAVHGMPPQGESTGLAIEDATLFARILTTYPPSASTSIERIFEIYSNTRKPRIDAAYEEALARWENLRDKGWFGQKVIEFFTSVWLWWMSEKIERGWEYDVRGVELVL